jgi:hypothetical protein
MKKSKLMVRFLPMALVDGLGRLFQAEINIHSGGNFGGAAIDRKRLIPPVADGIDRGAEKGLGSLDYVQRFNRSGFRDGGLQGYVSFDVVGTSELWILGSGRREQITFHDVGRDISDLRFRGDGLSVWGNV